MNDSIDDDKLPRLKKANVRIRGKINIQPVYDAQKQKQISIIDEFDLKPEVLNNDSMNMSKSI